MTSTIYLWQNLLVALFSVSTILATHFLYHWQKQEWIVYRQASERYEEKKWQDAVPLYEKSLSQGLNYPPALFQLAHAYLMMREFSQASYWYRKYLGLRPEDQYAREEFAGSLVAEGRFEEALKEYQKITDASAKSG